MPVGQRHCRAAQHGRQPGIEVEAAGGGARHRAAGRGVTRNATAPRAGEPPISTTRSSAAARPAATVRRPSALNGTAGAGQQARQIRATGGDPPAQGSIGVDLPGEGRAGALQRPLPVQRHVERDRRVAAGLADAHREMPGPAGQPGGARGRIAATADPGRRAGRCAAGEIRVDIGEHQIADRDTGRARCGRRSRRAIRDDGPHPPRWSSARGRACRNRASRGRGRRPGHAAAARGRRAGADCRPRSWLRPRPPTPKRRSVSVRAAGSARSGRRCARCGPACRRRAR